MTADPDPSAADQSERHTAPPFLGLERLRRSPLAHRAAELARLSDAVALVELPFLSMVNLRMDPASTAAERVAAALGVVLPSAGATASVVFGQVDGVVAGRTRSVLWLGPDEWLVVGPDGDTVDLVRLLSEAVGDGPGSVVDVSANRGTLVVSGPNARDLLEKGCTLDLHPRAFGVGRCAQTTFARAQVLIWRPDGADGPTDEASEHPSADPSTDDSTPPGPVYRLLFRVSFADYFADWLTDAAAEFTAPRAQHRSRDIWGSTSGSAATVAGSRRSK